MPSVLYSPNHWNHHRTKGTILQDGQGSRPTPELGAKEGLVKTHSPIEMNEGNRRGAMHHAVHANSEFPIGKYGDEVAWVSFLVLN